MYVFYRKSNNKQHMNFIFSGYFSFFFLLLSLSFSSSAKNKINGLWMRRIDRRNYCMKNPRNGITQMFFILATFDFEKQIFFMFMIIHAANEQCYQHQKCRSKANFVHCCYLFIFHSFCCFHLSPTIFLNSSSSSSFTQIRCEP